MTALLPNDRFVSLSPSPATTVLAYDFELTREDGIAVERVRAGVTATLTLGVDYSFPDGLGDDAGGTLTLASGSQSGDVYRLFGEHPIERQSDFSGGQKFGSAMINADLDALTLISQEARRDIDRSWKAPFGQTAALIVPGTAGQTAVFDDDGNLVGTDVAIVAIGIVAEIADEVVAVAGNAENISAVAANEGNIDTVAGIAIPIAAVAGNAANINAVAANAADIDAVAANGADIDTVAGSIAAVNTAAANMAAIVAAPAAAAAAATSVAALPFAFSTTTADADPSAGNFRLNHATVGSATKAFIDNVDADGLTQTAVLDSWDDSTTAVRGRLTIRAKADPTIRHTFNVTGTVVDDTGYRDVTIAYVGGAGTLTNGMACWLIFERTGDAGAGVGDVVGPASSTNNGFVKWDGTTGKLVKNGAATIATADIGDAQVSPAKLDNGAAVSVLGRSANSSGVRADISAAGNDTLFRRVSNALDFGQLTAGMVPSGILTFAMLASAALASNGDMMAGTASKLLSAAILKSSVAYQTLTDGANIAWDMASGNNAQVVLAGNRTLSNMSNPTPQFGFVLKVTATTSTRTLTLSANYIVATGVEAFPISVTTSETVYIIGFVDTSGRQIITGVIRT